MLVGGGAGTLVGGESAEMPGWWPTTVNAPTVCGDSVCPPGTSCVVSGNSTACVYPNGRPSFGYTAGSKGGKLVSPPRWPSGSLGGRGAGYRLPGSKRAVTVGDNSLRRVGQAKCVPCSERARAARG